MRKMFVGNLAPETSEADLRSLFKPYGTVRSIHLPIDVFSRQCRGFAFVEMEGHEARAAMSELDGKMVEGRALRVNEERGKPKGRGRGRRR